MERDAPQVEAHRLSREGCSGAEVARRLGVTRMTISRWLRDPDITAAAEVILGGAEPTSSITPSQSSSTPSQPRGARDRAKPKPARERPAPGPSQSSSTPSQTTAKPEPPPAHRERPAPRRPSPDDEDATLIPRLPLDPPRADPQPGDPPWLDMLLNRLCRGTELETAVMFAGVMPREVCDWILDVGEDACARVLQAYAAGQAWREDLTILAIDRANGLDARIATHLASERRNYQTAQANGHLAISDVWGALRRVLSATGGKVEMTPAMLMIERLGLAEGRNPAELDLMEDAG